MAECRNGYIYRNGKCSKRSNNPFKIWQSYIGAVIFGVISMLPAMYSDAQNIPSIVQWIGNLPIYGPFIGAIFILPGAIILGFLLGYVLTILYRRVFK